MIPVGKQHAGNAYPVTSSYAEEYRTNFLAAGNAMQCGEQRSRLARIDHTIGYGLHFTQLTSTHGASCFAA